MEVVTTLTSWRCKITSREVVCSRLNRTYFWQETTPQKFLLIGHKTGDMSLQLTDKRSRRRLVWKDRILIDPYSCIIFLKRDLKSQVNIKFKGNTNSMICSILLVISKDKSHCMFSKSLYLANWTMKLMILSLVKLMGISKEDTVHSINSIIWHHRHLVTCWRKILRSYLKANN